MRVYQTLFAGLVLAAGIVYEVMALRMPRGRIGQPGPGFFPMIVGAVLVLTAAACLVQALASRRSDSPASAPAGDEAPIAARQTSKTWLLLGFLVLYVLTLQPVGFPIAVIVFLMASIWAFGYRKWLPALGIAAALTVVSYLTFIVWLKVPLPLGILDDLLD